jgi:hypothetical protein
MSKKLDDFIQNAVISALHKGENGTGKSIASGSKALRPTYFLDCEDRMASVASYYRKIDGHTNGLEYDTYSMTGGYHPLAKRLADLKSNCPFKTIVLATLTSYADIVLRHLANKGGTRATGQAAGKMIAGIKVNELEDFNGETAAIIFEMLDTFKFLQTQGKNIIVEAHVLSHEVKVGTDVKIARPLVTGGKKAAAKIPGYFNEAFHFYIDADYTTTKYKIKTRNTGDDFAKTSFQELPNEIDWTGKDLYDEIFKYLPKTVIEAPRIDPNAPKNW